MLVPCCLKTDKAIENKGQNSVFVFLAVSEKLCQKRHDGTVKTGVAQLLAQSDGAPRSPQLHSAVRQKSSSRRKEAQIHLYDLRALHTTPAPRKSYIANRK
jgi:hypothetical protein